LMGKEEGGSPGGGDGPFHLQEKDVLRLRREGGKGSGRVWPERILNVPPCFVGGGVFNQRRTRTGERIGLHTLLPKREQSSVIIGTRETWERKR